MALHGGLVNLTAGALTLLINIDFTVDPNLLHHTVPGCAAASTSVVS